MKLSYRGNEDVAVDWVPWPKVLVSEPTGANGLFLPDDCGGNDTVLSFKFLNTEFEKTESSKVTCAICCNIEYIYFASIESVVLTSETKYAGVSSVLVRYQKATIPTTSTNINVIILFFIIVD